VGETLDAYGQFEEVEKRKEGKEEEEGWKVSEA
jgi:hypothetical protein